jgi:hypothetical protein
VACSSSQRPTGNFSLVFASLPSLSPHAPHLVPHVVYGIGDYRHASTEMPMPSSIDISTPRRKGTPVKERVTGISHATDDPAHLRAQRRAVLPSNSPSSTYSPREKRRQENSPSPEPTEQQMKDLKKRKLSKQSCSYCLRDKQKVYQVLSSFSLTDNPSVCRRHEPGQARNVSFALRRACLAQSPKASPVNRT